MYNPVDSGVRMNNELARMRQELSDDNVKEMLLLAERLRESSGSELDDSAIQAVAEATGAPLEYVRLALRMLPEQKQSTTHRIRNVFLGLEEDVRRHVVSGAVAAVCANMLVLEDKFGDRYGFFGVVFLIFLALGIWNVCVSKDSKTAAISGALFGGILMVGQSVFSLIMQTGSELSSALLVPHVLLGGLGGFIAQVLVAKNRGKLGLKDPAKERQALLRQLVDLQDKLKSGEQSMSFLSLDVVGSTRMKAESDPLSVEFTFNEYHQFVEGIVKRYGGRVHSTAGDGITCAFDHPQQAYAAARNIQAGLVELNTFRNKIGIPIVLRAGIHHGSVIAPSPGDIQSLNFAHVIDVSAHLQKACPPGGIVVSLDAACGVPGGMQAIGAEIVEAQDVKGVVWQPKQTLSVLPPSPAQ